MAWTLDDIIELNSPEPGQSRARVDILQTAGALHPAAFCQAAAELELRDDPHVALLFQLPYRLPLTSEWHDVSAHERGVSCALKVYNALLCTAAGGELSLRDPATSAGPQGAEVTQVTAIFPVWGKRLRFFDRYASYVAQGHSKTTVVIPQRDSWHQNRPMTLRDFEVNLAGRLLREMLHVLRSVLPAMSLITRSELPVPETLYGCQAMLLPGRLKGAGNFVPVLQHFLTEGGRSPLKEVNASQLKAALQRKYRTLGRFEAQLFALNRLSSEGESALALIGSVALLEWFFNSRLGHDGETFTPSLGHLLKSGALNFLPSQELDRLRSANSLRHKVVHGAPPDRYELTTAVPASSHGRQLAGDVITDAVGEVINLAFDLFRLTNATDAGRIGAGPSGTLAV